jgi:hypothetical protein
MAKDLGAVDHDTWVEAVRPIAQVVSDLAMESRRIREDANFTPAASSEAMRELSAQAEFAGEWEWEPVDSVDTSILLLTIAAEDHMESFSNLVLGPRTPVYSFTVLGRAALECQALAAWLSEPGIGTRRRVARGLNERLYGAAQQQRLPEQVRPSDTVRPRLMEADQVLTKLKPMKGRPPEFEERRLTQTELVRRLLGDNELGHSAYSYFSAVAHGVSWGLTHSVRTPEQEVRATPGGPMIGALVIESRSVAMVAALMILGHAEAFGRVLERTGWNRHDWPEVCLRALKFAKAVVQSDEVAAPLPTKPGLPTAPPGLWLPS